MGQRDLLLHFMRSLKTKGLLDKDVHSSLVDVFVNLELPKLLKEKSNEQIRHNIS